MSLITFDNVTYSNHVGILFADANFTVNDGDRIGLIGNNGTGKTTLFKCIMGELQIDKGNINKKRGLKIGYIEQSIPSELENLSLLKMSYVLPLISAA